MCCAAFQSIKLHLKVHIWIGCWLQLHGTHKYCKTIRTFQTIMTGLKQKCMPEHTRSPCGAKAAQDFCLESAMSDFFATPIQAIERSELQLIASIASLVKLTQLCWSQAWQG